MATWRHSKKALSNGISPSSRVPGASWEGIAGIPLQGGLSGALPQAWLREVGVYEKHAKLDGRWLDVVIVERLIPANLT